MNAQCSVAALCVAASLAAAQSIDFAEGNANQWATFASDNAAASVVNSTQRVKDGASSILFTTASGFDTGVRFPAQPTLNLNASAFNTLTFWEFPENTTPIGWQGNQPIIVIRTGPGGTGGTIRLEPTAQLTPLSTWRLFKVPLAGGQGWTRTTTGAPTLASIQQIEIHHDTWDYGFRIWFDGVRFMNLDPNSLPPPGPPPPAGVDANAVRSRVLLYIFNPIMENFGSRRMNAVYGWQDPLALTQQIISDFEASSYGKARYEIAETVVADEYPRFQDGFQHTDVTFAADWDARNFHNSTFDYVGFCQAHNLGQRIDAGELDEVWLYAPPIAGMWESCMAGQGAYWINGPAYPSAGNQRVFPIMGWNFERGVGEAIHSWGHRAENVMAHSYGPVQASRSTTWNRFVLLDRDAPGLGGVGNVHFPVNAVGDYDYANPRFVLSNADAWLSYPALNDATRSMNFREWSPQGVDPQREYLNWWYSHMPHVPGRAPDFYLANWWRYLLDLDQFKGSSGNLMLTIGIPTVQIQQPVSGALVGGIVPVRVNAEVDGALGRVDLYVNGVYTATDTLAPYTFRWDARNRRGIHVLVAKAYELQNGTEAVSQQLVVTVTCGSADFNDDGDVGTDADIEAFFRCLAGSCCPRCPANSDINGDGDVGTDADIEAFFRMLAGNC